MIKSDPTPLRFRCVKGGKLQSSKEKNDSNKKRNLAHHMDAVTGAASESTLLGARYDEMRHIHGRRSEWDPDS